MKWGFFVGRTAEVTREGMVTILFTVNSIRQNGTGIIVFLINLISIAVNVLLRNSKMMNGFFMMYFRMINGLIDKVSI
jgi:hypothetical protein